MLTNACKVLIVNSLEIYCSGIKEWKRKALFQAIYVIYSQAMNHPNHFGEGEGV